MSSRARGKREASIYRCKMKPTRVLHVITGLSARWAALSMLELPGLLGRKKFEHVVASLIRKGEAGKSSRSAWRPGDQVGVDTRASARAV